MIIVDIRSQENESIKHHLKQTKHIYCDLTSDEKGFQLSNKGQITFVGRQFLLNPRLFELFRNTVQVPLHDIKYQRYCIVLYFFGTLVFLKVNDLQNLSAEKFRICSLNHLSDGRKRGGEKAECHEGLIEELGVGRVQQVQEERSHLLSGANPDNFRGFGISDQRGQETSSLDAEAGNEAVLTDLDNCLDNLHVGAEALAFMDFTLKVKTSVTKS